MKNQLLANVSTVLIRLAEDSDAEAIRQIYNLEVLETTATFDLVPRSIEAQLAWQHERSGAHAVLVSDHAARGIVAFASLSPFRSRPAYRTTVESSVYVNRDHRGQGIARELMGGLVDTARTHGFHSMIARIADSQEGSIALHKSLGFETVGTELEVGRKFNRWLDVVVMQLVL